MGLRVSEFAQEQERRRRPSGWYERIAPQLTDEQRTDLDAALADKNISATVISVVLQRWGYEVSMQAVGNHRRRYVA